MNWFKKLLPPKIKKEKKNGNGVPVGIWKKCDNCETVLYKIDFIKNSYVCNSCDYHHRLSARDRLNNFFDDNEWNEKFKGIQPTDFLKFTSKEKYSEKIKQMSSKSGEEEAVIVGTGKLNGIEVIVAAFEFKYFGGSMGSVVGEKLSRAVNEADVEKKPFICFSASGGARMQEGLTSLYQMSKVNSMLKKLSSNKIPFISVLTDPTMGGVSASFAMIGDVVISEPGALIGFAGPRVIQQTVNEKLPENFQKSEFLFESGLIDLVTHRHELKTTISSLLDIIQKK